jgi:two-component system response regulator RegA
MDEIGRTDNQASLLLVDDDEVLSSVLSQALVRKGFKVTIAHDYRSAVAAAGANPPGFAVVDLKLPGGSGLSLVKRLVNLRARVVVLTGYGSIATAIEAIKLGAHYYLTKPSGANDIVAALHHRDPGRSHSRVGEKPLSVDRLEWEHIQKILSGNDGNVSATARSLGMHRRTLQRKLSKHPVRG